MKYLPEYSVTFGRQMTVHELMRLDGVLVVPSLWTRLKAAVRNSLASVGVLLAVTGCATGTVYGSMDMMDRQDRCMMQHTWDTTILSGYGIGGCASTSWYTERRAKDGVARKARP